MLLTKKIRDRAAGSTAPRPDPAPAPAAAAAVPLPRAAAPARRRLPAAQRQLDVVEAVLALAAERDPGAITTVAIAERVGVTHGALFRHFVDKDAIWAAVFDRVSVALGGVVRQAFAEGRDPLATLRRVFVAHVAFVEANPGVPRILFHELQRGGGTPARARLRELVLDYRGRLAALFEAAKRSGQVDASLDAEAAAVLFIGTVQGIVLHGALFTRAGSMQAHARRILPLLLHGFCGARR
jgi:AcrR family transcriptional regulator